MDTLPTFPSLSQKVLMQGTSDTFSGHFLSNKCPGVMRGEDFAYRNT